MAEIEIIPTNTTQPAAPAQTQPAMQESTPHKDDCGCMKGYDVSMGVTLSRGNWMLINLALTFLLIAFLIRFFRS